MKKLVFSAVCAFMFLGMICLIVHKCANPCMNATLWGLFIMGACASYALAEEA